MSNGLVSHGELGQIVTNHVCLDFDWVPVFTTIDIDDTSAHFWDNDGISEMGSDSSLLFADDGLFLGDSEFLDKSIIL
jgi:hypothetical protein